MQEIDFDAWATARVPALLRFAYLVTGSHDAADEAVQTALGQALEKWDRVRRTEDPDRYVRRMITHAHVTAWRRFGRRQSPVAEVRGARSVPDPATSVSEADVVWRVCLRLPRKQRAAVVLRFYEDLDDAEIAAVLDCSESTVRSQIHRALAALRAELERQEADDA
ncbi:MAG TPA: SigE family RNA polymerase sigma factor [Marmoricola sp.]|nr:SigE family RNA polymerase sigma factor [Marmoricola sp.]